MNLSKLSCQETLFLFIDIQERLLPAISNDREVKANTLRLLQTAAVFKIPLVYTEQYPKGLGRTDSDILEVLEGHAPAFEKTHFSCCDEEGFVKELEWHKRKQVVLWGIESHICVLATAMDLLRNGFSVWLAADACGSRKNDNHEMALQTMIQAGALVVPTETVIYQLMKRSGTPEFKALLPLFKE
ncbi:MULTISPECIES: hydrolase [Aminobacterium]|jgi:nicotinamidase-related amidase|uniref:hydrolase n=1 Tax=Aminobacterium TaxID=81466 RepID=UPI0004635815|nr:MULTISPECIES: hydrolase [Aminobacterium]